MMSGFAAISGVASGVQWRDMIDQIMQLEGRPAALLRQKANAVDARINAWDQFRNRVSVLQERAKALSAPTAFQAFVASVSGPTSAGSPLSVNASATATPGSYSVRVLARAESEKLGGDTFATRDTALGIAGEFLVNGSRITVDASHSLDQIVARVNAADAGVTASIQTTTHGSRLVLTSTRTGAAGIDLVDGTAGTLRELGIVDDSTSLKHQTSSGFRSDALASAFTAVGTLRGFDAAPQGTVTIGSGSSAFQVDLDLASMSLTDIAAAIDAAAIAEGSAVRASVVTDGGSSRLVVSGTATAIDDNGVLQTLGVLNHGRSAVAQQVTGAALTTAGGAPATAATLLSALDQPAAAGDTIRFEGTRADGSTFAFTHTISAGDSVQTLLDRLNGADGYDGGATAAISADGRITITDAAGGPSSLALRTFAGNESGASLDLGDFDVTRAGRARAIVAGRDAQIEIDGVRLTRASNTITDAIAGVTFNVNGAAPDAVLDVAISRDTSAAVKAVRDFVDAYNALTSFVNAGAGVTGPNRPVLAGDAVVRSMRDMLRNSLEIRVAPGISSFERLGAIGITIDRTGTYTFDAAIFEKSLRADHSGVARLFQTVAETTNPAVRFVSAGDNVLPGTYAIDITSPATVAAVTGSGFGATYNAAGAGDRIVVQSNGSSYALDLTDGMSMDAIVAGLNAQFTSTAAQTLGGTGTLFADAGGTVLADESTPLAALHTGAGATAGFADGTVLTFSGTRANGTAFVADFTIDDASTQTLGDVRAAVAAEFGDDATVEIIDGRLAITAARSGASAMTLAISSDAAEAGFPFGSIDETAAGRATSEIRAENVGGQLRLVHGAYGASHTFSVSYDHGDADGELRLGLAAGSYAGTNVTGTIGGFAATGNGSTLIGAAGTPVHGLTLLVDGTATGASGDIVFSRGAASATFRIADLLLGKADGSVGAVKDRLDASATRMRDRADAIELRLENRREQLIKRFTAMERALATAQAQSQWLTAQLASLKPPERR